MTSASTATGWLGRLRSRMTHDIARVEAAELLADSRQAGCTPMSDCASGERVVVHGTVKSVIIRPRERVPAFEAEVYDGSGRVRVLWMGRRIIQGIDPGRMIQLSGRITDIGGQRTMFNPRYALRPKAGQ